jgi:hypothetical protein
MTIRGRMQAFSASHPLSVNRKIDNYLTEHLPDLMDEHKIADRNDISDLDAQFENHEKRMTDLENWRKEFDVKITDGSKRIERLKMKYGIKEG